jgi:hypothetical protein
MGTLKEWVDGGYVDEDEKAGRSLWGLEGSQGFWRPECWDKSPEQLQSEAKSMNAAAFSQAAVNGGKHSNPPASDNPEGRF